MENNREERKDRDRMGDMKIKGERVGGKRIKELGERVEKEEGERESRERRMERNKEKKQG